MASWPLLDKHAAVRSTTTSSIITKLNDNDVLQGRGAAIDRFVGNVRFRSLVKSRKDDYMTAHQTNEKKKIAVEIIAAVHASRGRFLRRTSDLVAVAAAAAAQDGPLGQQAWEVMEDTAIMEKVKQALRDCCVAHRISRDSKPAAAARPKAPPKPLPHESRPENIPAAKAPSVTQENDSIPTSEMQQPVAVAAATPVAVGALNHGPPHHSLAAQEPLSSLAERAAMLQHALELQRMDQQRQQIVANYAVAAARDHLANQTAYGARTDALPLPYYSRLDPTTLPSSLATYPISSHAQLPSVATSFAPARIAPFYSDQSLVPNPYDPPVPGGLSGRTDLELLASLLGSPANQEPTSTAGTSTAESQIADIWREIPNSYLVLLGGIATSRASSWQTDSAATTFGGNDLLLLLRTKRLAELASDYVCLQQIRSVLQLAASLPSHRLRLSPTEMSVMGQLLVDLSMMEQVHR